MKKFLSLTMGVLLLHVSGFAGLADESPLERAKKAQLASEVRAGVAALGTGKSSVVRVVLNDKTSYHGYITEITDEGFVIADARTGAMAPIAYPEVKGIRGNNLSTGAKVGIGVAVVAAVVVIAAILASRDDDDERQNGQIICVTSPCP